MLSESPVPAEQVTLVGDRKAAEAARRTRAADTAAVALRRYARENDGRFVLFGSCAGGSVRFDSDLDVLVDFPAERVADAWRFVEEVRARLAIPPDLHDAGSTTAAFVDRVVARGRVLS